MLKEILIGIGSFLVGMLIPVLMILAGAGLVALGINFELAIVGWFGVVLAGAGIIWGFLLVAYFGGLD